MITFLIIFSIICGYVMISLTGGSFTQADIIVTIWFLILGIIADLYLIFRRK